MVKLSKWEKDLLPLSLVTTKTDGRKIVRRNKALLKAAKKNEGYDGYVGCPHCQKVGGPEWCVECAWQKIVKTGRKRNRVCLVTAFDGVSANQACAYRKGENEWPDNEGIVYDIDNEGYYSTDNKKLKESVIKILKAHILWGQRIADGTYKEYAKKGAK